MVTAAKTGAQDMPPPGGYAPLQWERIKLRTIFGVKLTLGLTVLSSVVGYFGYGLAYRDDLKAKIEMRSARHAMIPMLIAERDRAFLKQVRKNREMERELMKNVPEWEVGTYFREPIYITRQNNYYEPSYAEFMTFADPFAVQYKALNRHFY